MKKGDKVIIRDSSYSKVVTDHGLEDGYKHNGLYFIRKKQGVIIETNCRFPNPHEHQEQRKTFNNTVVRTNSGKVVFIEERFLKLANPIREVTMAEVCTQFGEDVKVIRE